MNQSTDKTVSCTFCHHGCRLAAGQIGLCGVRKRSGDKIVSLVYGKLAAENIDPIEKKPLYHVLPGSLTYSIATHGCNFRCAHCQNSSISQVAGGGACHNITRPIIERRPEEIVERARSAECKSISYTYVEPTVFFDYAYDCALLATDKGLGNIFVSNGYMTDAVLDQLAPVLTAINIDLKSWNDSFYKKVCGATLAPVLKNIRKCVELGVWIEVTTLLIPGMNDSAEELKEIAGFLAGLNQNIPWHVSAFYPSYKLQDVQPTPLSSLNLAVNIGRDCGLNYVYAGNVSGPDGVSTQCPSCGTQLLVRNHFTLSKNMLQDGTCPSCNVTIAGVWT